MTVEFKSRVFSTFVSVNRSDRYKGLRAIVSLLLLSGYFLNVITFESFHQAVHHHDHSELHTAEAEADSCHRAIYHGDTTHDCDHKSHVTQTVQDCDLCKVTVSRYYFSSADAEASDENYSIAHRRPASTRVFGNDLSLAFAPRGPPALS